MKILKAIVTWFISVFAIMAIFTALFPNGIVGTPYHPIYLIIVLVIPILTAYFACTDRRKVKHSEKPSFDFPYIPVGTNAWIRSFGLSSNRVVEGLYRGQGVLSHGGVLCITLPMFKRVLLDRSTACGFSILCRRPNTSSTFVRSGKYQVKVLYRTGEYSIIEINWQLCELLIQTLRGYEIRGGNEIVIPDVIPGATQLAQEWYYQKPKKAQEIREMQSTPKIDPTIDVQKIIKEEEMWRRKQMVLPSTEYELHKIDGMDGHEFEYWCAELLRGNGYTDVEVTKGSGDQGVDVLAVKDGIRYAIQCKCYSSNLGNGPVQEVHAGKALYHCQVGVVMTNQYFTAGAKELADATGVLLWDRDKLERMLTYAAHMEERSTC